MSWRKFAEKQTMKKLKYTPTSTGFSISIANTIILATCHYDRGGWFRVFGYGLSWKPKSEGLTFSQRNGKTKYAMAFGMTFTILKK